MVADGWMQKIAHRMQKIAGGSCAPILTQLSLLSCRSGNKARSLTCGRLLMQA